MVSKLTDSHDAHLVGNIKGLLVGVEYDVGILVSIGADESVDSFNLDVVHLFTSFTDGVLVGPAVNDEHERVVVFNHFHCAFASHWVLDDGVLVPGDLLLIADSTVLGLSGQLKGVGSFECHGSSLSVGLLFVGSFLGCGCGSSLKMVMESFLQLSLPLRFY